MNEYRASIVVPAYNAAKTLAECLEACSSQNVPVQVIVVDDGSTDRTAAIVREHPVEYLYQDNAGPASARNFGARAAKAHVVAFTDSDCVPEPNWIEALLKGFVSGAAAVGGTYGIANPESLLPRMIHAEIRLRHERFSGDVDFLGSFNVAYDRERFWDVGGFDEDFKAASGEDNDLAYRLADRGNRLRFTRDAVVKHYHPQRLLPYLRTQSRHGFWRMKLYAKHPQRAAGDRYASLLDLWSPGVALLAVLFSVFAVVLWPAEMARIPVVATAIWVNVLWCVIHVPKALAMYRAEGDARMLLFVPVAMLRDLARAWGMGRGAWRFLVRRKTTG